MQAPQLQLNLKWTSELGIIHIRLFFISTKNIKFQWEQSKDIHIWLKRKARHANVCQSPILCKQTWKYQCVKTLQGKAQTEIETPEGWGCQEHGTSTEEGYRHDWTWLKKDCC